MRIWNVEDGSCLDVISNFPTLSDIEILPASEGLQVVTSSSDSHVRIYDLSTKQELACLSGHVGIARIVKLLASPNVLGYKIVSAGYDGTVRIWEWDAGKAAWRNVRVLDFSDALLTRFGDEAEGFEVEGEDFLSVEARAKRVWDMQMDGTIAYVVGEGAEIVGFDLSEE